MKYKISSVASLCVMLVGIGFSAQSSAQTPWLCQWLLEQCNAGDQSKCQYYYSQCMSYNAINESRELHIYREQD